MTEAPDPTLDCQTCGPASVPAGSDVYQVAVQHAAEKNHTVYIHQVDVITPEGKQP